MKVICNGYKDCIFKLTCYHSTPHEYEDDECSKSVIFRYEGCECDEKNIIIYSRKKKLKNLKDNSNEKFSKTSEK